MNTKAPSAWKLEQAMTILMKARESLLQEKLDDEVADILASDPETCDAMDVLHRLIRGAAYDREMVDAAAKRVLEVAERKARYAHRYEVKRKAILEAMQALDLTSVELPDLTTSVQPGKPSVVVSDDTDLPPQYVRVKREPDKTAIKAGLDRGEIIPGASLSNAPPFLQIRGS